MSGEFQEDLKFEAVDDAAEEGEALILDIDGYEGPLHLLLELARKQKVDLARLSILELAEQYIAFIKKAQDLRIELAADYLVMASWLAYLKSRLILPRETTPDAELPEEQMAAHLAFRLQRLDAMRKASDALHSLPMTGQAIFVRGAPEGLRSRTTPLYQAEIFDLMRAYGEIRSKAAVRNVRMKVPLVYALEDARNRLARAIGSALGNIDGTMEWLSWEDLLPETVMAGDTPISRRSILASSLLAGLELAKEGEIDIRQTGEFAPIYVRAKTDAEKAKAQAEMKDDIS